MGVLTKPKLRTLRKKVQAYAETYAIRFDPQGSLKFHKAQNELERYLNTLLTQEVK